MFFKAILATFVTSSITAGFNENTSKQLSEIDNETRENSCYAGCSCSKNKKPSESKPLIQKPKKKK